MAQSSNVPVITIDGPSGTGKGTISQLVADHLGWHLLDSGALYRVVAAGIQHKGILSNKVNEICDFALAMTVTFSSEFKGSVTLDGEEISAQVRLEQTAEAASQVAAIPELRQVLLQRQIDFRQPPGLVADGRDMGTVVFPTAGLKIYLTASPEERAHRRYNQLINKGVSVNLRALLQDIASRDERDANRAVSPLRPAQDALVIDTTSLSIDEVFEKVFAEAGKRFPETNAQA